MPLRVRERSPRCSLMSSWGPSLYCPAACPDRALRGAFDSRTPQPLAVHSGYWSTLLAKGSIAVEGQLLDNATISLLTHTHSLPPLCAITAPFLSWLGAVRLYLSLWQLHLVYRMHLNEVQTVVPVTCAKALKRGVCFTINSPWVPTRSLRQSLPPIFLAGKRSIYV